MTVSSGPMDPLETLHHENEVAESLLERLVELGTQVGEGAGVLAGTVHDGVRLLDEYLHRLHAERVDGPLGSEARPVAMSTCFEHLDSLRESHAAALAETATVQALVQQYAEDPAGTASRLGRELVRLASEDHDRIVFEETYPLSCLVPTLPDDAVRRLADAFAASQPRAADLERHIAAYLARPSGPPAAGLAVRCAAPGCPGRGQARVHPGVAGGLALELPGPGWRAQSRARRSAPGRVGVSVRAYCPEHSGPRSPAPPAGSGS